MRATDTLFAGKVFPPLAGKISEASGHYYFRDNFYADNGMIPFLLLLERLGTQQVPPADAVRPLRAAYPVSGDINCAFETRQHRREAMDAVSRRQSEWGTPHVEPPIDGLSVRFATENAGQSPWRFTLRDSQTEPLLRLNVETRGSQPRVSDALATLGGLRETPFCWEMAVPRHSTVEAFTRR